MSDNGVDPSGLRHRPQFPDDVSKDSPIPGYVDPLDVPQPGAGPVLAVRRFYTLFATFHGRASRAEFWWVVLFSALTYTALSTLAYAAGAATGRYVGGELELGVGASPFTFVAAAFTLVPVLGALALLTLCLKPSDPDGARFDRIRPAYPSDLHPEEFIPPAAVGPSAHSRLQQNFGPF